MDHDQMRVEQDGNVDSREHGVCRGVGHATFIYVYLPQYLARSLSYLSGWLSELCFSPKKLISSPYLTINTYISNPVHSLEYLKALCHHFWPCY